MAYYILYMENSVEKIPKMSTKVVHISIPKIAIATNNNTN